MQPMSSLPRFEQLALKHLEAAYNLAFWLVRSRPDAEDVVQDAYLRALRAFQNFHGEDMRPWLLAIVRHTAYRWLNNRRRAGNVISIEEAYEAATTRAPAEPADHAPNAEARLIGAVEQDYVVRALAELPPTFREVVVLREIEGLSLSRNRQRNGGADRHGDVASVARTARLAPGPHPDAGQGRTQCIVTGCASC